MFCGANAAVEATCITVGDTSLGKSEEKVVLVEARVRPSARRKCDGQVIINGAREGKDTCRNKGESEHI